MNLVPWAPPMMLAELELVAARVPAGVVTEREWLERLADRVTEMALKESPEMTEWACKVLDLPTTDDPHEAGEYLVLSNLNLRTHLSLAMLESVFPCAVTASDSAETAMGETDFQLWVDMAAAMVSASSLD